MLPEGLRDQLGDLLEHKGTRETLVDNMVKMTKEAHETHNKPIVTTIARNYMARAGSPLRGRTAHAGNAYGGQYRPPRADHSGFYTEDFGQDETGIRDDGNDFEHADIDFDRFGAGTLPERDRVLLKTCLLYTSPSPRDKRQSRMPSSA